MATLADVHRQIAALKYPDEQEIGHLLANLGLEYIGGDIEIRASSGSTIGEIDMLFQFNGFLFIIEITNERNSEKINQFFSKWGTDENLRLVRSKFRLSPRLPVLRVYCDLSRTTPSQLPASISHNVCGNTNLNRILYKDDIDYFKESFRIIGMWARNDLLNVLKIPRSPTARPIDAIQFYIGDTPAFIFVEPVKSLLESCYIFRRRLKDDGYQRALNTGRIGGIARDIQRGTIKAFPNSILINTTEILAETPLPQDKCPGTIQISLPTDYCSCRIIDGQHRLLAFAKLDGAVQESHTLPVVAFQNIELSDEMRLFIDINSKQKRIDGNLILLIKSDFTWPRGSPEYIEKTAVDVIKKLNENDPLKGDIYLGVTTQKKKGKITLTTLVSGMINNNLVGGRLHLFQRNIKDVDGAYKNIRTLFAYLKKYCGTAYPFFIGNKGLRIIFRFVQIFERNRRNNAVSLSLEDAIKKLSKIITPTFIKKLEDFYGDGGAHKAVDAIFIKLKRKYRMFSNIETDLRKFS